MKKNFISSCGFAASLSLALGACVTPGDKVATVSQPKTPIAKTVTNLEHAKRCMDQLFLDYGKRDFAITAAEINDATGSLKVSRKEIINAIAGMTERSNAFSFFTIETDSTKISEIQNNFASIKNAEDIPRYYIRGSISQMDNGIAIDNNGGSVTTPFASIGYSKSQTGGTISIDLQLADLVSRKVVQNAITSNTITILSDDRSSSTRGLINTNGISGALSVSISSMEQEGRGQAVRTLLEYSLIELLGKFMHVPYQRCLGLEASDPGTMQVARRLYDDLDPAERTRAIQQALASVGGYRGPIDGAMNVAFRDAVTEAKMERGLTADGRVDFQLFNALYGENVLPPSIVQRPAPNPATQLPATPGPAPRGGDDPLGLDVALVQRSVAVGDAINVRISTKSPAKVYCYYDFVENSTLKTVRILPSRHQQNNIINPGGDLVVPRPSDPFEIHLNTPAPEHIACVATQIEYKGDRRLSILSQPDMVPLQCEYPGAACPVYEHSKIDNNRTSAKILEIRADQ